MFAGYILKIVQVYVGEREYRLLVLFKRREGKYDVISGKLDSLSQAGFFFLFFVALIFFCLSCTGNLVDLVWSFWGVYLIPLNKATEHSDLILLIHVLSGSFWSLSFLHTVFFL